MSSEDANDLASKWIKLVDTDANGTLETDEFKELCTKLGCNFDDEKVKDLFSRFDGDGDGSITSDELAEALIELVAEISNEWAKNIIMRN